MAKEKAFPFMFVLCVSLTPLLAVEVPRMLSFWPMLIGLIMSGWLVFGLREKLVIPRSYIICAAVISGLALLSCLWSISPEKALKDAIKVTAILGFGSLWIGLCNSVNIEKTLPYLKKMPFVFFTLAAVLILFELLLDMPLYRIIRGLETHEYANPSEMNRGIVCLAMFYFIALGFVQKHLFEKKLQRQTLYLLLTAPLLFIFIISESQSSQIAFLVGVIALILLPSKSKITYPILAFTIAVVMALTPFIVDILYDLFVGYGQQMPWLSDAYAGNRAEIWHFVTVYAMHNPLYGYGIEATSFIDYFEHGHIYHESETVLHPHNFSVQVWMEFGAIGVMIFSALFYLALNSVKNTSPISRKYLLAVMAPAISVSSVAYGMWQSWWIGYIIFILGVAIFMNRNILRTQSI